MHNEEIRASFEMLSEQAYEETQYHFQKNYEFLNDGMCLDLNAKGMAEIAHKLTKISIEYSQNAARMKMEEHFTLLKRSWKE